MFPLFLFLYTVKQTSSKIITIPLTSGLGGYEIILYIGNSTHQKQFQLDMEIDYLHIKYSSPSSIEMGTMVYYPVGQTNMTVIESSSSFVATSKFYLTKNKSYFMDNFPFILLINCDYFLFRANYIPLSFKYQNESYSFIHRLYNDNVISNRGFGILYDKKIEKAKLYIGGYEEKDLEEYRYKTIIPVNTNKTTWGCNLNSIFFENYTYNINDYFYFQSNALKITVPKSFYDFLEKTIFSPFIEDGSCQPILAIKGYTFQCDCDRIALFPDISFVIEGKVFTFKKDSLFDLFFKSCYSAFMTDQGEYKDKWILGLPFLRNVFIYFDYDNSNMIFLNKLKIDHVNQTQQYILTSYLIIVVILCNILGLFLLVYLKIKVK